MEEIMQTSAPAAKKQKKKKGSKRKWIILVLVLLIIIAGAFAFLRFRPRRSMAVTTTYQETVASIRNITTSLTGSGTLQPADSYTVTTLVSGEILSDTITVVDETKIDACVTLVENALYNVFEDENAYNVGSMSSMLDTMNSLINVVITILAAIAAISLVVGGIGIMNIMLVSVTERTREIGIRKALGARESSIMQQFVIEAAVTSALGGILGILLGYGLSSVATVVISTLLEADLVVAPSVGAVIMAVAISAGIGVFFGWLPARKAALLNPIDALRYD